MTLEEIRSRALQLLIYERWCLIYDLLRSLQRESLDYTSSVIESEVSNPNSESLDDLDPWTQSLVGIVQLGAEDPDELYIDYLDNKYS